jgi:hypothetical protein
MRTWATTIKDLAVDVDEVDANDVLVDDIKLVVE